MRNVKHAFILFLAFGVLETQSRRNALWSAYGTDTTETPFTQALEQMKLFTRLFDRWIVVAYKFACIPDISITNEAALLFTSCCLNDLIYSQHKKVDLLFYVA